MNQLMNFLQSASNTAASNVSGPVDLIAAALRAAGVPVPRNALLSSEWMREKGLTAPVQQGASQVAGDTLGLLAPVAAAAKAPEIARGLLQVGKNAAAPRAAGMKATQRGALDFGPRAEALRTAQRNAAKPVSEGGLGLPPNNTAADRARAMGFDVDGFHGMPSPMRGSSFDPDMVAKNDYGAIGQGVYIDPSRDASYANSITSLLGNRPGSNVMPVKVRSGNMMDAAELPAIYSPERSRAVTEGLKQRGVDSVMSVVDGKPNEMMVIDPSRIRSRFAAFDPARIKDRDILAGLAAMGLLSPLAFQQEDAQ